MDVLWPKQISKKGMITFYASRSPLQSLEFVLYTSSFWGNHLGPTVVESLLTPALPL